MVIYFIFCISTFCKTQRIRFIPDLDRSIYILPVVLKFDGNILLASLDAPYLSRTTLSIAVFQ